MNANLLHLIDKFWDHGILQYKENKENALISCLHCDYDESNEDEFVSMLSKYLLEELDHDSIFIIDIYPYHSLFGQIPKSHILKYSHWKRGNYANIRL